MLRQEGSSVRGQSLGQIMQKLGPVLGLLAIVIVLSIMSPQFLSLDNLLTMLRQVTIIALLAFGMTFVILTGGIDLSVGSTLALAGALTAGMMASGIDPILAVLLGVLAGAVMGAFNGVIIAKGKVAPFIATLATMTIFRGLTLVYTDGRPVTGFTDSQAFDLIGRGYLFGIPIPVIIMFVIFFILLLILKKTVFGRHVYAIGGNEEASILSGIKVNRVKIGVYSLTGALAALAGIILTSRLGSASPNAGFTYELDAIAAVVLGGTSLAGGRGWIFGTLIGALIIGVLNNGLNLLGVSSNYQQIVKGAVILLAVILDRQKSS
ncbi:ribose ABC transporter permease [Alkalibacillus haloalkaliphilus]|nr:ribose ABC transporter permease [Alkalibacillus haloalkaliphilus]MDV2582212.1 ribose ABC transporter permease [Alkalibacillus haloalkaliphilus]